MAEKGGKQPDYDGSTPLKSVMQEKFVSNVLSGMPQYEAYKQAGYSQKSENALMANSTRLIRKDKIKARLDYKRAELARKYEVNEERITKERVKIGFANIQDFVDENGKIRPIKRIDRDKLAAVSEIKLDPKLGTVIEFKFHSKQEALDKLSRQLGLYEKDNSQSRDNIFDILAIVG